MIGKYCELTKQAFPNIIFITSNFVHDEPLAGCFADEICDLFYNLVKEKKIESNELLEWLKPIIKYKDKA